MITRDYGACSAHLCPRLPLFDKLVMMSLCPANIHGDLRYHFFPYPFTSCKCDVTKIQICVIIGLDGISRKNNKKKDPLAKYQTSCAKWRRRDLNTCSDDSIQILLKLAWIETSTIQGNFRRMCMES